MNGKDRRKKILNTLAEAERPIPGSKLAGELNVSRQVIVQDIALLRAENHEIISTNAGYTLISNERPSRVIKLFHSEADTEKEMQIIVDNGGIIEDDFVFHKTYGVLRAEMGIRSRLDIKAFLSDIASGKSTHLMNLTSGYHYHTVSAPSVEILELIQDQLWEHGFLAKLQEYEPVNFYEQ